MKVQPRQYAKLLLEMTQNLKDQAGIEAQLRKLADIIRDNKDQLKLERILEEYQRMYNEHHGIVEGQVTSAVQLDKHQLQEVMAMIAGKFETKPDKVQLRQKVDASIKGGLVIQVGNEIWDGSVRTKLERLRSSIA